MLDGEFTVEDLFEKVFKIKDEGERGKEMEIDKVFESSPWSDEAFIDLKSCLNSQKSRLNGYDMDVWQAHTFGTKKSRHVVGELRRNADPELFTVAWSKFYECVSRFDRLVPETSTSSGSLFSLHLCEAPGAFIASLNHYLKSHHPHMQWKWLACTMNPYYEGNYTFFTVKDDRLIKNTLDRWEFGKNNVGDLLDWDYSQDLIEKCRQIGEVSLITADGSVDCSHDPGEQERTVASLHFCEVITALQVLSRGGTFFLKIFTIFEHFTINLMYLLSICFNKMYFFKPITSRCGNSEKYVVCMDYRGHQVIQPHIEKFKNFYGQEAFYNQAMFSKDAVPPAFLKLILNASCFYSKHQCSTIDENIRLFEADTKTARRLYKKLRIIQNQVKSTFMLRYALGPIDTEQRLCSDASCFEIARSRGTYEAGSYEERKSVRCGTWETKRTNVLKWMKAYPMEHYSSTRLHNDRLPPAVGLKFKRGKTYPTLQSSTFVTECIFNQYRDIYEFRMRRDDTSAYHKTEYFDDVCSIEFAACDVVGEFYPQWERSCLIALRTALAKRSDFDTLVMKNYDACLTRVGAGTLLILAVAAFESIIFDVDSTIRLVGFRKNSPYESMLEKIVSETTAALECGQQLLEVVPLSLLLLSEEFVSSVRCHQSHIFYIRILNSLNE